MVTIVVLRFGWIAPSLSLVRLCLWAWQWRWEDNGTPKLISQGNISPSPLWICFWYIYLLYQIPYLFFYWISGACWIYEQSYIPEPEFNQTPFSPTWLVALSLFELDAHALYKMPLWNCIYTFDGKYISSLMRRHLRSVQEWYRNGPHRTFQVSAPQIMFLDERKTTMQSFSTTHRFMHPIPAQTDGQRVFSVPMCFCSPRNNN